MSRQQELNKGTVTLANDIQNRVEKGLNIITIHREELCIDWIVKLHVKY
jgi:hypothetical protein